MNSDNNCKTNKMKVKGNKMHKNMQLYAKSQANTV
jgi:hypothetical protein